MYTKDKWEVRTYVAPVFGNQAALTSKEVWAGERRIASTINEANSRLIVAAVNSCIKVNPDNPLAVAQSIEDLYEACKEANRATYHDNKLSAGAIILIRKAIAKAGGKDD